MALDGASLTAAALTIQQPVVVFVQELMNSERAAVTALEASALLQRRHEGGKTIIARGGLALNEPLRMADKGVLLAASADRLDADAWRKALAGNPERRDKASGAAAGGDGFPLSGLALRAGELRMLGQRLNDVSLRAVMEEGGWQARLTSKEATGEIVWRDQGRGRLQARFRQLSLGTAGKEGAADQARRAGSVPVAAVIHHGVDTAGVTPTLRPAGGPAVFLGRMSPSKGLPVAIEVARRAGVDLSIAAKMRASVTPSTLRRSKTSCASGGSDS